MAAPAIVLCLTVHIWIDLIVNNMIMDNLASRIADSFFSGCSTILALKHLQLEGFVFLQVVLFFPVPLFDDVDLFLGVDVPGIRMDIANPKPGL